MVVTKEKKLLVLIFIFVTVFLAYESSASSDGGISSLRFDTGKKKWQVTLDYSRTLTDTRNLELTSTGLWEQKSYLGISKFTLGSSLDITEYFGLQGAFTWVVESGKSRKTNLWTGEYRADSLPRGESLSGRLLVKYVFWRNAELQTYFLIPVFSRTGTVGLTWSRDPVMIFPKFSLMDDGFGLEVMVSFVANSSFAFTGDVSSSSRGGYSTLGLGGSVLYRNGEYNGVRISASLKKGRSTSVTLGAGLTYGEEK